LEILANSCWLLTDFHPRLSAFIRGKKMAFWFFRNLSLLKVTNHRLEIE